MNDDIFERFIKSIGIVNGFEFVAKGLFYIVLVVGISCFLATLIDGHLTKKRFKKEEEERVEKKRHAELLYLKKEIENLKHKLEEAKDENRKYVVALNEDKDRRIRFENHLKNRTAQAAVNEALGHFL